MTNNNRPRVAAIGLNHPQISSIETLCGDLRPAESLPSYLNDYSWTETDVMVLKAPHRLEVDSNANLMTIGLTNVIWWHEEQRYYAHRRAGNRERELTVSAACPDLYRPLATQLTKQLNLAVEPPAVIATSREDKVPLVETTSGHPVALRLLLSDRPDDANGGQANATTLLIPETPNLVAWFRAFLADLNESDPGRVPQAPPRLSEPSDWYTPKERALASRISDIDCDLQRLSDERDQLEAELTAAGEEADGHKRRALWADGRELVAAAQDILSELGFVVRDMDAELSEGEPRREDLRLTLSNVPAWEAIVEVKGYPSGTKTNDARQIREHRDLYITEEGRTPDLTIWLANPFRRMDPSSRPGLDPSVSDSAKNVGAVHMLASDLYRQWALVATDRLDSETVIQSLRTADPGLWIPPAPQSDT